MASDDRNPDSCGCYHDGIILQDLPGLIDHFHFFFSIGIIKEYITMRKAIPVDGMRIGLLSFYTGPLILHLPNSLYPCSGNRLVSRNNNPFDFVGFMQGGKGQHHLYGRAIRIGNDLVIGTDGRCIDFRHNQTLGWIHTPC